MKKNLSANTLNIELCDMRRDGVIKASEATIENAIDLIRRKMRQYEIDIGHVIRHFDVNGKHCPAYLMDAAKWNGFKARIAGYEVGRTYRITEACLWRPAKIHAQKMQECERLCDDRAWKDLCADRFRDGRLRALGQDAIGILGIFERTSEKLAFRAVFMGNSISKLLKPVDQPSDHIITSSHSICKWTGM